MFCRGVTAPLLWIVSAQAPLRSSSSEASEIDGANEPTKFFAVTLPHPKPATVYVATMSVLAGFSLFTESHVLWNGKFAGDIGLTTVAYPYQNGFRKDNFGYAATVGIVLMLLAHQARHRRHPQRPVFFSSTCCGRTALGI